MQCQTQKPGTECLFMKKTGCSYNGGQCFTIVESCEGCTRVLEFVTGKVLQQFPLSCAKVAERELYYGDAREEGREGRGAEDQSPEGFEKSRWKEVTAVFPLT